MAEDDSQKTEDPTGKRLDKAREKGQVANSTEVKNLAIIMAGAAAVYMMVPDMMRGITRMSYKFIENPHNVPTDFEHLRFMLANVAMDVGVILWPFLTLLVIVAIAANLAQVGLIWSTDKISVKWSNVSLLKGLQKKFSMVTITEFVKGVMKIIVTGVVSFSLILPLLDDLAVIAEMELSLSLERIYDISIWLLMGTIFVMTAIAAMDFAYTKYSHTKSLKMSKQEVKDESKESQGDPLIKSRIRKLRYEHARQRMMAAVPRADVVITNPTHFAVALEYKVQNMTAPKLLAKGVDSLAFRIREVAEEHNIPIVENPPLARALYATVELDEEIPEEHYKAVAEVIGYIMRLRGDLTTQ